MSGKGYYLHNRLPLWVALHIHIIVAVAMSLSCLIGCSQRELCYDHSHKVPVNIEFDWSDAPDAQPATMVVWFFRLTVRMDCASNSSVTDRQPGHRLML